jgi:ribosomal-protein-alanine N-acetyltransferase
MNVFFETERLILKVPDRDDYASLHALQTDNDVMHFIGDGSPSQPEKIRTKLTKDIEHFAKHHFGTGLVFEKDSRQFVGQGGLTFLEYNDQQPDIELDLLLHKTSWGKGYGTEIVKGSLEWGFKNLPVTKLVAVIDPRNVNSQKVVLKAGLSFVEDAWFYNKTVKFYEILK